MRRSEPDDEPSRWLPGGLLHLLELGLQRDRHYSAVLLERCLSSKWSASSLANGSGRGAADSRSRPDQGWPCTSSLPRLLSHTDCIACATASWSPGST